MSKLNDETLRLLSPHLSNFFLKTREGINAFWVVFSTGDTFEKFHGSGTLFKLLRIEDTFENFHGPGTLLKLLGTLLKNFMGRDTLDIFRRSGTFLKLLDAFLKIFIDTTWGLTGDTFEFWKCWYIDHTFWNKKSIFLCSRKNRDMILLTRGQKRRSRGIVLTTVRNYSTYYITSRQSWKSKKK